MRQRHWTLRERAATYRERASNGYHWLAKNEAAARAVVLVHGITGNKADMAVLGDEYAVRGLAVYAPDLPGHGAAAPIAADGFDELADWLTGFLTVIGRIPDLVVGNSFAAAICYRHAARGLLPGDTRLVLACPTPGIASIPRLAAWAGGLLPPGPATAVYHRPSSMRARVAYLSRVDGGAARRWMYESEWLKAPFLDAGVMHRMIRLLTTRNPYTGTLPVDVRRRTTLVLGTADNVVTRSSIAALRASMPEARTVVIPAAGHILHFEAPRHIAKATT